MGFKVHHSVSPKFRGRANWVGTFRSELWPKLWSGSLALEVLGCRVPDPDLMCRLRACIRLDLSAGATKFPRDVCVCVCRIRHGALRSDILWLMIKTLHYLRP